MKQNNRNIANPLNRPFIVFSPREPNTIEFFFSVLNRLIAYKNTTHNGQRSNVETARKYDDIRRQKRHGTRAAQFTNNVFARLSRPHIVL